jgi:hypothetical protein
MTACWLAPEGSLTPGTPECKSTVYCETLVGQKSDLEALTLLVQSPACWHSDRGGAIQGRADLRRSALRRAERVKAEVQS